MDTNSGTGGTDTIFGGTGADVIVGGPQEGNVIVAGSGPETIFGSDNTIVYRGVGAGSTIYLGSGTDLAAAGPEPTFIQAGTGSSTVSPAPATPAATCSPSWTAVRAAAR